MKSDRLLERLLDAADRSCVARGEAQWTNGYRAAVGGDANQDEENRRLYNKEQRQWKYCGRTEGLMRRAFLAVLREARKGNTKSRRLPHGDPK